MLAVFGHFAAGLLAFATLFRAGLHVRVIGECFAFLRTPCTDISTGTAHRRCERTTARCHVCGGGTCIRAILARHERLHVFSIAGMHHVGTMSRAGVAGSLTVRTCLGARLKSLVMFGTLAFSLFGRGSSQDSSQQRNDNGPGRQRSNTGFSHDKYLQRKMGLEDYGELQGSFCAAIATSAL